MVEVTMKQGEPYAFTIVDNRVLRERGGKINSFLRL
jgi:hypothetical protein